MRKRAAHGTARQPSYASLLPQDAYIRSKSEYICLLSPWSWQRPSSSSAVAATGSSFLILSVSTILRRDHFPVAFLARAFLTKRKQRHRTCKSYARLPTCFSMVNVPSSTTCWWQKCNASWAYIPPLCFVTLLHVPLPDVDFMPPLARFTVCAACGIQEFKRFSSFTFFEKARLEEVWVPSKSLWRILARSPTEPHVRDGLPAVARQDTCLT